MTTKSRSSSPSRRAMTSAPTKAARHVSAKWCALADLTRNGLYGNGDISTVMSPRTVITWAENARALRRRCGAGIPPYLPQQMRRTRTPAGGRILSALLRPRIAGEFVECRLELSNPRWETAAMGTSKRKATMAEPHSAYRDDLYTWSCEQAALLRAGRLPELDVLNLAEEIEDVGSAQYDKLESALTVVLLHMLKWDFQPQRRSRGWQKQHCRAPPSCGAPVEAQSRPRIAARRGPSKKRSKPPAIAPRRRRRSKSKPCLCPVPTTGPKSRRAIMRLQWTRHFDERPDQSKAAAEGRNAAGAIQAGLWSAACAPWPSRAIWK